MPHRLVRPKVVHLGTTLLISCSCLAACGRSSDPPGVAARVGTVAITQADVAHRAAVMTLGHASHGGPTETRRVREQALAYLIHAQWIIQEAPSEHRSVSREEVDRRLAEKERTSFPGGAGEYREFLRQTGQRRSDLRQEVEVELALEKLHEGISKSFWPITAADVAAYYRAHRRRFGLPELREVWIIDRKSAAAADAVKKRVQQGVRFGSFARTEQATGPNGTGGHPPSSPLEAAIDAAKPHALVGPVKYKADYLVFELKKLTPARTQPLSQVAAGIKQKLTEEREREALARFVREWRIRWLAMTECEPGYVVAKCNEYGGPRVAENPLAIE